MRISVLTRVDELLFSSSKPRKFTNTVKKVKDLSIEKNIEIYKNITADINKKNYEPNPFLINFNASDAKSSLLLHKFLQTANVFERTGSTTSDEKDSKVIIPE